MREDRLRWNRKHRAEQAQDGPCRTVQRFVGLATVGRALDIAAGTGADSLFLAQRGFLVEAIDISDKAVLNYMPRHLNLQPICADLDQFELPRDRYDLIINLRYLNRRLFPYIQEALRPGGLLIFETFIEKSSGARHAGFRRDYLLRPNELLHGFLALHVLYYEETAVNDAQDADIKATLVARR
jgi:tellurite methyltransferase